MKKHTIILLLITLISIQSQGQDPEWLWVQNGGGYGFDQGNCIDSDTAGNTFSTGIFNNQAFFGPDTLTINGTGVVDFYVAKADPDGNWLWAQGVGGHEQDASNGIATDAAGNSYVTGYFSGTATFGSTELTSIDSVDIFAAKIDTDGNWVWAAGMGGTAWDQGWDICFDPAGNSYVTGSFFESISFGSTTLTSYGDHDIFVAKLDPDGNWLWAIHTGTAEVEQGYSIAADANGNSYVTGFFEDITNFGSTTLTSNGEDDIFVAKLDTDGNWLWANGVGGLYDDYGRGISLDSEGNCYFTGQYKGNVSFGPFQLQTFGIEDMFVAKLDADGNWLWANDAGGSHFDTGKDIYTNQEGFSYLGGYFRSDEINLGPIKLTNVGGFDIVAAKLDPDGNWLWAKSAGGADYDFLRGITADGNENCYVSGLFSFSASFGPHNIVSFQFTDAFIAKLEAGPVGIENNNLMNPTNAILYNYPNPFNQSTTIVIDLEKGASGQTEIEIYNAMGQKIESIPIAAGEGKINVSWNAENSPPGMYFYKVNMENSPVRKMILMK